MGKNTSQPPANGSPIRAQSTEATPSLRVLVVEDCPVSQVIAKRLLKSLGHQVVVVSDGRPAVEQAADGFDLILMDMQLPTLSGPEAAQRIRALEAQQGRTPVPIVAVTANAREADIAACRAAGMSAFLPKPMRRAALVETIREQVFGWVVMAATTRNGPHPTV